MTTKYQRAVKRAGIRPVVSEEVMQQRDHACYSCEEFAQAYGCKLKGEKCRCRDWRHVIASEKCPLGKWKTE